MYAENVRIILSPLLMPHCFRCSTLSLLITVGLLKSDSVCLHIAKSVCDMRILFSQTILYGYSTLHNADQYVDLLTRDKLDCTGDEIT